ncbi:hypothetical protein GLOIN_2v1880882 [Rhizophagus clarus]|uniref:Uncharacterized protein n=1 Tax=Rhizophagus clarus TaxID=94130 RepID=A0A8H3MFA3_9GLOM|nr:hypothetical protein GLOIN_2v1880882 [Rhizophagus clarus]
MELWLVEDAVKLVNPANIEQRIVVWLCDMPEPDEYDYYIKEIVYYFDGHWKYREIATRHKLPCEYITLSQSQQDLPTLKIFLDIYIDDFGTYRNVYHSLRGVYLQFGNMPLNLCKQIKNHFLIGLVPFGADFNDFIKPVIQDIKSLENGLIMQTLYGKAWVIGGIGCITADLPQGNDLAEPGSFNVLKWDQHIQTPQDAYHSMAGKARTLLDATFNIFNANGEKEFLKYWKCIEKPTHWSRMPNPVQHCQSFMFSDILRIVMLMPFILQRFLKSHHIKTEVLNKWRKNSRINQNLAVSYFCKCWTIEAKVLKLTFSNNMTENTYQELQEMLKKEHEILIHIFSETFTNLPNLHVNVHLLRHACNFATLTNTTAVGVKEMVHRTFKIMVLHMNCKVIELDFTRRYNTIQALCHLIDSWTDPRFSTRPNALSKLIEDLSVYRILTGWYATENSSGIIINKEFEDDNNGKYFIDCLLNGQDPIQMKIYIGDIIELPEESEECPLYNIQKPEESRWLQVFPITFVDHNPHVFFIHNCKNTCNTEHDESMLHFK